MRPIRALRFLAALLAAFAGAALAQVCPTPPTATTYIPPINTYYTGTGSSVPAGSSSVPVGAVDSRGALIPIVAGDVLLVIQMQGADIDPSNTNRYGDGQGDGGTGYTTTGDYAGGALANGNFRAGQFEYAVASGPVSGGAVPIFGSLANTYTTQAASSTNGRRVYQVLRVPQYASVAITTTITAIPWNGTNGGVIAMDVAGNMNFIGGTIDASGRGFRGGGAFGGNAFTNAQYNYVADTNAVAPGGGVKGEGIAGTPARTFSSLLATLSVDSGVQGYPGGDYARGAPGNAGGGSNQHNGGGGGGGNGARGGNGGRTWNQNQNNYSGEDVGGFGGEAITGVRAVLGGGGGSADINNQCAGIGCATANGGPGGGIVLIRAGSITGAGSINVRGADAPDGLLNATDGAGGGGAGGTVVIQASAGSIPGGLTIDLRGGRGGNSSMGGVNETDGPGGGGAGGRLLATVGGGNVLTSGGVPGVIFNTTNPALGTSDGANAGGSGTATTIAPGSIPGGSGPAQCLPTLTVTKSTPTPTILPGTDRFTYSITVTNTGTGAARLVQILDNLVPPWQLRTDPVVFTQTNATRPSVLTPAGGATNLTFGAFDIAGTSPGPAGSVTATFVVDLQGAAPGKYDNSASVTFLDPTTSVPGTRVTPGGTYATGGAVAGSNFNGSLPGNTTDDVTILAGPTVTKAFAPATIVTGGVSTLTINFANPNPTLPMTGVALVDDLPLGIAVAATPAFTQTPANCAGTVASGATAGDRRIQSTGATLAAAGSCQISVAVTSNTASRLRNIIPPGNVTGTVSGNLLGNLAAASDSLTVIAPPFISKTFTPNTISPGGQSTLVVSVTNPPGNIADLTGVAFADSFPAGITNVTPGSVAPAGAGCTGNATSVNGASPGLSVAAATVPIGTTCTWSTVVTKGSASPAGGDQNQTGAVTATGPVATTGNTARDTLTVAGGTLAPTLGKSFGAAIIATGGTTTMSLVVTNPNATALTVLQLTDALPAGLQVGAVPGLVNACGLTVGGATAGSTTVSLTGGSIPAGGACTVTLTVTATAAGDFVNTTSALTTLQAPGSNIATARLTAVSAPTATKSFSPTAITAGAVSVMRIRLFNPAANTVPLTGVAFTDTFPAGLRIAPTPAFSNGCGGTVTPGSAAGDTSLVLAGGTIGYQAFCEITVNVTAVAAGTYNNSTGPIATSAGATGAAAAASLTVDANTLPPIVSKVFSPTRITAGGTSRFSLSLGNPNGAVTLTGVGVVDNFPAGMTIVAPLGAVSGVVSADNPCGATFTGGTVGATSVTVTGITLTPLDTCVLSWNATSSTLGNSVNTTAAATATGPFAQSGNVGSATLTVLSLAPPNTTKDFNPRQIASGGLTRLTIALVNANPSDDLTGIAFTDTFPAGMSIANPPNLSNPCAFTIAPAVAAGNTSIVVTGGTLPAGGACQVGVDVTYTGATGNVTNTTSTVTSALTTPGNTATGVLSIVGAQPPQIAKAFSPAQIPAGGTSTMTVTITNPNATFALTGVAFTDTYPAGLTHVTPGAVTPTGTGCATTATAVNGATPGLSLAAATIPAAGACTWSVAVTKAAAGNVVNTTGAVTATGPAALTGNTASTALGVGTLLAPQVDKFFSPDVLPLGSVSALALVFTNPNAGTALTGITLTDTFPAGLTVAAAPGVTSGAVSATNTCGLTFTGGTAGAGNIAVTGGQVPAGGTCLLVANVTTTTAGSVTNTTGSVVSANGGTGNTASARLNVVNYLPPQLAMTIAPAQIAVNGTATMTFTVANPNPNTALTGIAFSTAAFPGGWVVANPTGLSNPCGLTVLNNVGGALAAGSLGIQVTAGTVPAGGSCTVAVNITDPSAGTNTETTTAVTATGPVALTGNAGSATLVTNNAAATIPPQIAKSFLPAQIPRGGLSVLTFTITNPNAVALTGINFTDTFPAGMTVASSPGVASGTTSASNPCGLAFTGGAAGGGNINVTTGTVPANGACTLKVNVTTSSAATLTNTTGAVGATGPAAVTGNTAQGVLVSNNPLPPVVKKSFIPSQVVSGGTSRLQVEISNPNPQQNLTGIALADAFPANIQVAPTPNFATDPAGACTGITVTSGNAAGNTALNFNALTVAAGAGSCRISVDVVRNPAGTGVHTNTTGAVTATGPVALTGNTDSATLTFVAAGTLQPPQLAKQISPAQINVGGVARLRFTISNPNPNALAGVQFTDTFPAGMVVAATPNLVNSCALGLSGGGAGANNVNVTASTLNPSTVCFVELDITTTATGNFVNTTSAIQSTTAGNGNSASAILSAANVAPPVIAKSFSPASAQPGDVVQMTFAVTNPNLTASLTGLAFTDTFPAGLVVAPAPGVTSGAVSAANSCGVTFTGGTAGAGNLNVTNGIVPAGGICTLTVNVTKASSGSVTNTTGTVTATGPAAVTGNTATASLDIATRPPQITKGISPRVMVVGGTSTLTIGLTNPNSATALNQVAFVDNFPAGLAIAAGTNATSGVTDAQNTCGLAFTGGGVGATSVSITAGQNQSLAAGTSCTLRWTVTSSTLGLAVNTTGAVSSSNGGTGNVGSQAYEVTTAFLPLALAKSFQPAAISPNGISAMTFTVRNDNRIGALTGVAFTDAFPVGLTLATPAGAVSGTVSPLNTCGLTFTTTASSISVTGGSVADSTTCSLVFYVTSAITTLTSLTNTTSTITTARAGVPAGAAASAVIVVGGSLLPQVLTKQISPAVISAGGAAQLRITIRNPNVSDPISALAITDAFPANLSVAAVPSFSNTCGGTVTAGNAPGNTSIALTGGVLTAGATCTIETNLTGTIPGTYNNTVTSNSSSAGSGSNPSASLTIVAPTLTKAFTGTGSTIDPGGTTTLTFTIANGAGNPLATGITFTDALPSALAIAAVPNVTTTCPAGGAPGAPAFTVTAPASGTSIVVTGASLNAGVASCTVSVDVTSSTVNPSCAANPASHTNGAGNVTPGANVANAVTNTCLVVRPRPTLTKAFGAATIGLNDTTTLAFTIDNTASGAVNRTGLAFTDALPAGLSVANPPVATTSAGCAAATLTGTANGSTSIGTSAASVNAGQVCVITFTVTGTTLGVKTNDAASITSITGLNNGVTPQVLTVLARPTVTKAFGAASIPAGGSTTLTVTLANANAAAIIGAAFTDTFPVAPGPMTLAVATSSNTCGGTLANSGGGALAAGDVGIRLTGGTIPAGGSCAITVTVTASVAGSYTNTLAAGAVTSTNAGANTAPASSTLTVLARPTVAKAFGAATIPSGGTTTLAVTVTNANAVALTGLAFTDVFPVVPGAMTLANATTTNTCAGTLTDSGGGALNAGDVGIQLAGGTVPANGSCTVTVNVTASTAGTYTNSIAAGGVTTANGGASTALASANLTVLGPPTVAKAFAPASIFTGANSVLTVTLTNPNATAITGAAFTDTYPGGLANAGTPALANTCGGTATGAAAGTSLALTGGTIPANGSCSVSVNVTSAAGGVYTNSTGPVATTNAGTGTAASAQLTVVAAITGTKSFSPATIATGGTSTLTVSITNPNTTTAITGLAFTDTYPAGLVNSAAPALASTCGGTSTATAGGTSLTLTGGTLAAGASCTITVQVTSSTPGTLVNNTGAISAANAPSNPGLTGNLVVLARPAVAKAFGAATIPPGGTTTLAVTVTNANAVPLTGLDFTDTFPVAPGAMTLFDAGAANTCGGTLTDAASGALNAGDVGIRLTGGTVPANGSCTVTVNVTASVPGAYTNTIAAGGVTSTNGGASTAPASANLTVLAPPTAAKAFAPTVAGIGQNVTLTITLTNANATAVTGVAFTDTYPAGLANATTPALANTCGGTATGAAGAGTLALAAGTIPANGSCSVTVTVVASATGSLVNSTGPIATTNAGTGTAATATLTVLAAPTVTKAFSPASVGQGQASTLTITLANPNAQAVTGAAFTDTYPGGLANTAAPVLSNSCGGTASGPASGGTLSLTGGTIPANGSCAVSVTVSAAAAGSYANSSGPVTTTNAGTGTSASATLTVLAPLAAAKSFTPSQLGTGATATLTLQFTNPNASAVTGLAFTDSYPSNLVNAAAPNATTSCGGTVTATAGGTSLTLAGATVAAGSTCSVTVAVTSAVAGTYANTLAAGAISTTNAGSNAAPVSGTVSFLGAATAVKSFAPSTIGAGGTSTLTIAITNPNATLALTGLAFTDTYPAGLVNTAAPTISNSCGGTASGPANGGTLSLTGGTLAGGASCAVSVTVTAAAAGSYVNGTGPIAAANANNGAAANATLTVLAPPTVAKAFGPTVVGPNQPSTLSITLTNANTTAVTGVAFTDTYPAGLVNATTPALANSCGGTATATAGAGSLALSGGTIPASGSCTVTVSVSSPTAGSYANATGPVTTANAGTGASAGATLVVLQQVTATKAFTPASIGVNDTSLLTITLANPNATPVTGAAFTDTYPGGLVNAASPSATTTCATGGVTATTGGASLAFAGGTVPGNASCTITVGVTSAAAGSYANSTGPVTTANAGTAAAGSATLTVLAHPTVAKAFAPTEIPVNGTSTITLTLGNANGAQAITGVSVTDAYPSGLVNTTPASVATTCGGTVTGTNGGTQVALAGGTIPAGGTCTITATVTSATANAYTNSVSTGTLTSANAGSNTAAGSATLSVLAPLTAAKAFTPASIGTGDTSVLSITFTNPNPTTAVTGVAFNDTYPANVVNTGTPNGTSSCGGTVTAAAGGGSLVLTGATVPAGGTCTVSVNATSAVTGTYVNSTGPITTTNAGTTAALTGSLTVLQHVSVAKAFSPNPVGANGASTLTITLTNPNATPLSGVAFTDTYPAGLVNFTPAGGATTCATGTVTAANGAGNVSFAGGSVAASSSCTITVSVTSATPASYTNTIAAGAVTSAIAGANTAPASATLGVFNAPSIAKSFAPAAIAADGTSTITFQLTNTNPVPLTAGAFTDTLANMRINATGAAGGTCAGAAGNALTAGQTALAFTGLTVPANGSCTVTVVVTSDTPGTNPNTTSGFTSNEAPLSAPSNTANLVVNAATPTIAKAFSPTSIAAAGVSTVTLTIANTNGTPLTNAGFTDTLANMRIAANQNAGGTCAGAAANALAANLTNVAITGLTIPANGSCTVTFTVTSNTAGTHPNTTSGVSSSEAGTGAVSNTASLTVSVNAATIAKAFAPASIAYVTGVSTLTFTLGNTNAIPLTAAAFTDTLSGMAIAANQSAGGTCAGAAGNAFTAGQTALSFAGLAIPATGSCTVTVTVSSNAVGPHPNTASGVTTAEGGTGAVSNTATLTVTALAPTVAKSFTPNTIGNTQESTLLITVGNPNDAPITITTATDTFPVNMVVAVTPHGATTCAGGVLSTTPNSVTLTGGTVPANGSCTFQIDVQGVIPGVSVVNVIPAGAIVTNVGANTVPASATLTILPAADIRVTKTGPATVVSGGALSYTIVVSNFGPDPANGATMSDAVPAPVTGVAASCGSPTGGAACGTVNVAGNAVTSTITTLPSGGSVTFTITGTAPATGTFTNSVVALPPVGTADPDDPGRLGVNTNVASVTTSVLTVDLQLAKTHAGSFTAGSNGTYTLVANNTLGVAPTSGAITVTDTLPAGLTFVSATGTGWSCLHVSGVVTCTSSAVIGAGAASANPITLVVAVGPTAVPNVTNTATISGGNEPAVNNGNNGVSDYTLVALAGANTFQPDGNQSALPGSSVFYPHTFVAGLAGTVAFSTTSAQSPAVPGWTQVIYRDTNCNGVLDGAETAAPLAGGIAVNPGDSVCIVVADNVPAAAPYNAVNVISVTATFSGPIAYTRTDTTTVGTPGGAGLTLAKAVRNVTLGGAAGTANTARPNDVLEYTVTYTNGGSGPLNSIVITDATPAFTTFQSATCTAPLPASLTACSATTQPGVGSTGAIAWTLTGSLAPNATGTVVFVVRVNP